MGTLKRRSSVCNVNVQAALAIAPAAMEEDCGCCTLKFQSPGGDALPGLAKLTMATHSRERLGTSARALMSLRSMLKRALVAKADFVMIFDFRHGLPDAQMMEGLLQFCEAHKTAIASKAKAVALLIKDNIFDAVAQGSVGKCVRACLPGCPSLVCHDEAAARDFFLASTGDAAGRCGAFVSVVDVLESPQQCPRVDSRGEQLVASLAPLRSPSRSQSPSRFQAERVTAKAAPTFHTLPNGDVRVIQSPSRDVILSEARSDWSSRGSTSSGSLSDGELPDVAALRFRCSRKMLQELVGAYFHVAELVVDAEDEATQRQTSKCPAGCFGGLKLFFRFGCFEGISLFIDLFDSPKAKVR